MTQFRSFEETLAIIGALAVAGIAYKLFHAAAFTSALLGLLAALGIAYATFFEFTLQDGVITYRNRFMQRSFPLSWVESVSVRTFWGGLPGRTFSFLMRTPPAPWAGYSRRTGLVSWPSATEWVETVNVAIQEAKAAGRH
jgi:hypothetical protein